MFKKIKNYLDWGWSDLNEIIVNKEIFDWFYGGDNVDICTWNW